MKLSILSALPLLSLPLTALAAPDLAGLVGWAADKLVDGEVRTMDSWNYVDCGEPKRVSWCFTNFIALNAHKSNMLLIQARLPTSCELNETHVLQPCREEQVLLITTSL